LTAPNLEILGRTLHTFIYIGLDTPDLEICWGSPFAVSAFLLPFHWRHVALCGL